MMASLKLQSELVKKLKSAGFRIYDHPPKTANYPFIMIGDDRQQDLDVKNGEYININSTILVFSTYNGKQEVKTIMEQIRQICYEINLSDFEVVNSKVDESFTVLDETNQVTQGVLTVNFKLIKGV